MAPGLEVTLEQSVSLSVTGNKPWVLPAFLPLKHSASLPFIPTASWVGPRCGRSSSSTNRVFTLQEEKALCGNG